jgi:PAS domain S-box-containing protein
VENVTKEKALESDLKLAKNRLKAVYDSSTEVNFLIGLNRKILNFNKSAFQLGLIYRDVELEIGMLIDDILEEEDLSDINRYLPKAFDGEKTQFRLGRIIGAQYFHFEATFMPVFDVNNEIFGCNISLRDVTQEYFAMQSLAKNEFLTQAIYDSTSEACSFIDKDLKIQYVNNVAKKIALEYYGKESKPGDSVMEYIIPDYHEKFKSCFCQAFEGEQVEFEQYHEQEWWNVLMFPVFQNTENQHGVIGLAYIIKNVSEQKRRELKLKESENNLQKIIQSIPHPLLIVADNELVIFSNEDFKITFGIEDKEIIGSDVSTVFGSVKGEKFFRADQVFSMSNNSYHFPDFLETKDKTGEKIYLDVVSSTYLRDDQRLAIIIFQDVTEIIERQKLILKQNNILQNIAWQQSHDLRGNIATLLGLCNLIVDYSDKSMEEIINYIHLIQKVANEADTVIRKIVSQTYELDQNMGGGE